MWSRTSRGQDPLGRHHGGRIHASENSHGLISGLGVSGLAPIASIILRVQPSSYRPPAGRHSGHIKPAALQGFPPALAR